ncbi:hypothetical protein [Pelagovum pacificum]|uniref:Uncharacterized protein n=1 Tax=Pelagovum pacificum TaxID=2588711 RepID=A0A5C5GEY0_9RHOB|nr:hypothetical protein [Pelagovum pacificum]QQA43800.1 hypothetical protein I8N54_04275 [Pelagovum pacificum]TNY33070.1 hypothetical protein FHY64_07260 [Pelagovum pacificum]
MSEQPRQQRGGAPVGFMDELSGIEAGAVVCLRRWFDGPEARAGVRADFARMLGTGHGSAAASALEDICTLCARFGRRPLMRHHATCRCLGADEACFANFIALAADGDREDAMLVATLLVRADIAPCLVTLAESLGLALRRLDRTPSVPEPASDTIH